MQPTRHSKHLPILFHYPKGFELVPVGLPVLVPEPGVKKTNYCNASNIIINQSSAKEILLILNCHLKLSS